MDKILYIINYILCEVSILKTILLYKQFKKQAQAVVNYKLYLIRPSYSQELNDLFQYTLASIAETIMQSNESYFIYNEDEALSQTLLTETISCLKIWLIFEKIESGNLFYKLLASLLLDKTTYAYCQAYYKITLHMKHKEKL